MNGHDGNNDSRLDRLIDGELSAEEYREFLQVLDREPDGWRRAALAFLEAQAFGQEIQSLRQEFELPQEAAAAAIAPKAGPQSFARFALAIAASFLVAFGLGAWWRSGLVRTDHAPAPAVAADALPSGSGTEEAGTELAEQTVPPQDTSPPQSLAPEQLTFVVDRGDGQSEEFEMPVYDQADAYARWLVEQSALPIEVERDLRRAGYRVERRRQWAPVRLRDGRQAVFPVDEVQITPVSNRSF
jgi:hypothetical protein